MHSDASRQPRDPTGPDSPAPAVVIVTGAHLRAEEHDRPVAYLLRDRLAPSLRPVVVCSDLWYLNQRELRATPTVSVGGPAVNALTAYLASRLPSVLAVEGRWVVLMDADADAPQACCWGMDPAGTRAAAEAFIDRHLAEFVGACSRE